MAALTLSDFTGFLSPEQSAPIFNEAARTSVVQRLARQVPLGASGVAVPIITGKPTAGWTAEGTPKHVTDAALGLKPMQPYKLTAMIPLSMEAVRANPGGIMELIKEMLGEAFGAAFDAAALHGDGPFAADLADTTKTVELTADTYADIVAGLKQLADDGKKLTGFVFDDVAEPLFLGAVDTNTRPLLSPSAAEGVYGTIIGRPLAMEEGVAKGTTIGFAGNWNKAAWGVVGGISYRVSDEATITIGDEQVSAFENNLVILRAEAEYGFAIEDAEHFVKFTEADADPDTDVTIPAVNEAPAAFTPAVSSVTDTGASVAFSTTDPDGDELTYKLAVTESDTPPSDWSGYTDVTSPQAVSDLTLETTYYAHVRAFDGELATVGTSASFTTLAD